MTVLWRMVVTGLISTSVVSTVESTIDLTFLVLFLSALCVWQYLCLWLSLTMLKTTVGATTTGAAAKVAQLLLQAPTPQQDFCATVDQEKVLGWVAQQPPHPVGRQERAQPQPYWAETKAAVAAIARILHEKTSY